MQQLQNKCQDSLGRNVEALAVILLTIEETDFEPEPNVSPPVSGKVSKSPESEICRF